MDLQKKGLKDHILAAMSGLYDRIPKRLTTGIYIIALSLFLLYDYNYLTRFPREPFQKLYIAGAGLGCAALAIRFLNIKNEDRTYWLISILLLTAGAGYYLVRHSYYFLVLAIFMVGARRVSDRALMVLYVIIAGFFFAVMVGQFIRGHGIPMSFSNFGGINSTDTQGMIFFIMVAYLFLRGRRITLVELIAFAAAVIWFWRRTGAENNMYCAMAAIALAVLMKIGIWLKLKWNKGFDILIYLAAASFIICGIVMIVLVAKYDSNSQTWVNLDRILHKRMVTAHRVYAEHPPGLWGSDYVIVGHGYDPSQNVSESMKQYGYTYIDSSYPQILITHGYIIYAMIIGAMTGVSWRYARKRDLYRVLLLATIAVDCMAEGHLKEINCNIWLLCLFADLANENEITMKNAIPCPGADDQQGQFIE